MRNIRKSAWRASTSKISFVRNSVMIPCTFRHFVSSIVGSDVTFSHSEMVETILIADDWQKGWEMCQQKEDYSKSGYIGQGTSKRVIYVCSIQLISTLWYLNRLVLQMWNMHWDSCMTEGLPKRMVISFKWNMRTWSKVMYFVKALRNWHWNIKRHCQVSWYPLTTSISWFFTWIVLEFRFNLTGAILGHFVDESAITECPASAPCGLPYWDFIATRLLPCGPIDGPIEKFTGNDDVGPGPGPKEHLTVALHAFTHYVAVWSRGNFLLCDLQGLFIIFSIMCSG